MNVRPKRRKFKDNPYSLKYNEKLNKYFIEFYSNKNFIRVQIDEKIFNIFDKFELDDLKIMNEYDNHIEHSNLLENTLFSRMVNKEKEIFNIVDEKIINEKLINNIKQLPIVQKRRIIKYYFYNYTLEKIAKEENCTKRAVKFSIDYGKEKLKRNLEKYYYI